MLFLWIIAQSALWKKSWRSEKKIGSSKIIEKKSQELILYKNEALLVISLSSENRIMLSCITLCSLYSNLSKKDVHFAVLVKGTSNSDKNYLHCQ